MSPPPAAPVATIPKPATFEYRTEGFRNEFDHRIKGRLNRLGKQGWEVVSATKSGFLEFAYHGYVVTLKRVRR